MTGALWLGLDLGTSSLKAVGIDDAGKIQFRHTEAYPSWETAEGGVEQDPSRYLDAVEAAIDRCGGERVKGIGLTGQTPTTVLVDSAGTPVRPAMTWQDRRAVAEAALLADKLGPSAELLGTALPWSPAFEPAKLLWLSRHEPDVVRRTRWVLQPKDFVGLTLTGSPVSDPWSLKGLRNTLTGDPATSVLGAVGWPAEVVPPAADGGQARGEVSHDARRRLGLRAGTLVSVGWSDAMATMLAAGAFDKPSGFVLAGTSSIVGLSTNDPAPEASELLVIPSSCAPMTVCYGPTQSAGASVDWLAGVLQREPREVLEMAARHPHNASLPLFVPYLAGERAPVWRPDARGVFLGLSIEDDAAALARSVVSGVCLSERDVLSTAETRSGRCVEDIRISGRGAAAEPWRSARVEALGRPLHMLDAPDATAVGAAMLGMAAHHGGVLAQARDLESTSSEHVSTGSDRASDRWLDQYRAAARIAVSSSQRLSQLTL
ncbi:Xylulose kinase [Pseudonocardia sp. Ae717_Ps2]|uniref:xylulokinase n=1 Tax=Pseudonocardia sp. Ae717_Ps2 TaxID=1885573 RepID=UPI00094B6613|nr:FGGY family carbohydrate kinase [Pseudonocardia sp. Ae717_Ps2]OLM28559.1 Xylulose kinase [Pseudonocardia sp. Ae717_Ps2]